MTCCDRINFYGWRSPTVLLFLFGLLKELRPSEPYITVILTNVKNFTEAEVMETIFPAGTYATMCLTIIIFLVTDALLYKPIIVLQAVSCAVMAVLLVVGVNIASMLIMEFVYGLVISCDVAYLTYLYTTVTIDEYPRVSALCRVAHLLGRLMSGLTGQAMVSTKLLNFLQLQYISVASGCLAFLVALALPQPPASLYFHRKDEEGNSKRPKFKQVLCHIKKDLRSAYSQTYVLAWSFWWAVVSCVYLQVLSYIQVLWLSQTTGAEDQEWNGYVEATYTLLGSGAAWLAARLVFRQSPWKAWIALAIFSSIYSVLLVSSVFSHNIIVEYILYIAFGTLYFAALTVASSEVAQSISNDSTALVFGVNTFVALVLQSILTAVITAKGGLALSIQNQFLVCGSICAIVAAIFLIMAFVCFFKTPVKPEENIHLS